MNMPSVKFRYLVFFVLLVLSLTVFLFLKWRKYATRDSVPPIPTAIQSPMGPGGHREWSKDVVHYPGLPVRRQDREWSHWEISQRHKALVLKDLPDYVTELRGIGAAKETDGTGAAWYFVVSQENMAKFEDYLLDLGIPAEVLHGSNSMHLPPSEYRDPENRPPPPAVPATELIFVQSIHAEGEGANHGMKFGKSSDTTEYYLINPNLSRASARIRVGWKTGNVQVAEFPYNPDGERM